ncbi:MAG: DUF4178 domain-containing protein [Planctomycetota bacterium]
MKCPNCAQEVEADRRAGHLVVCSACQSTILMDAKATRLAGRMAVLSAPRGPLAVGAVIDLNGETFTVLGRVRYGYSRGFWDEWYVRRENGKYAWISQDEENFTVQRLRDQGKVPEYATTSPGDIVRVLGHEFHVNEKDIAECEGAEGQIPFEVESGERTPFLDLSDGERFVSVEYAIGGAPRIFVGRRIQPTDLEVIAEGFTRNRGGAIPLERDEGEHGRERVVRSGGRTLAIRCDQCDASLPVVEGASHVECEHCGAENDLTVRRALCPACNLSNRVSADASVQQIVCRGCSNRLDLRGESVVALGVLARLKRPNLPVRIGDTFKHEDIEYQVVGVVRWGSYEGMHHYSSSEFLLFAPDHGYRFLIYEDGHFSFSEKIDPPKGADPRSLFFGSQFQYAGETWRVYERGEQTVDWVDGELTWVAAVGDHVSYMDAVSEPHLLSAEWTPTESEWYGSTYLQPSEVAQGLGVPEETLPKRIGLAPNQPYSASKFFRQTGPIAGVFALVFLGMAIAAMFKRGEPVATLEIPGVEYRREYLTEAFRITDGPTVCKARLEAPIRNEWVYLDVALIDEQDRALVDFSTQASYYEGVASDGPWTEGRRHDSTVFRVDAPGEYRFLLKGEASTPNAFRPLRIDVLQGAAISRYHFIGAGLCAAWGCVVWLRGHSFHHKKWGGDEDE